MGENPHASREKKLGTRLKLDQACGAGCPCLPLLRGYMKRSSSAVSPHDNPVGARAAAAAAAVKEEGRSRVDWTIE
jgi:hypothetical protein